MTTVAQLYETLLGRAPDPEGLAYWESQFGSNVDPTEASTFKSVAQITEPAAVSANLWNQVDPSAAINAQMIAATPTAAGSTMPTTVEDVYKTFYGTVDPQGAAYWKSQFGGNAIDPQQASLMINEIGKNTPNIDTGLTVEQAFKNYLGGNTDQAGIDFWKSQFGSGPLTVNQLSQLTNTQSGINTDTGGGGVFGTGIGPDVSWTNARDALEAAGVVAGNYFLPGSSLVSSRLVSEGAQDQLATDEFRLANMAAGGAGGYAGNTANYGNLFGGTSDAVAADNIDVGGGWNPATGTGDAATAAAAGATGVTSSASTPHLYTPSGLDVNATGLSDAVPTDVGSYGSVIPVTAGNALASGLTASQIIKALPLVPVVNQLIGDPLGLTPKAATPTGTTGFNIVPIPSEWKSPSAPVGTYSPIDLNSIFSNQNLLAGTQWQGLPNQRNVTFNDIFASGQQSTPMGSPVNVNNLVSAILGQTSTSQKSA